ncbi:MAG: addiction module protein [Planctomycetales bacterium]|nr:addiction module protein [Planctomycetales bacterium]
MDTAASVPIETFSVAEKLQLMERLWDDLSRRPADVPTPDWHGEILAERQAALREGRTAFVDWEAAKRRLRERLQ